MLTVLAAIAAIILLILAMIVIIGVGAIILIIPFALKFGLIMFAACLTIKLIGKITGRA